MATENTNTTPSITSRSNTTADSYIGSLISLTSKSEIRYEGVLYNINTEESSIGLKNVRSFGTEGRKKDGPQIPPSDKVYEYILFRGTDIKDLQVKSSPPVVQQPVPINNDPAIIQSHYPRSGSSSASMPSVGNGPLNDLGTQQMGAPGSNFQGGLPLYQPGGNLGTWGAPPPPPNANGSGLAMPMYWQGYYGPPNGLPHLHQQSLLRPPPGLSVPPSMQQPMQYPNFNTNFPTGATSLTTSNLPTSSLPSSNLMTSNLPAPNMPAPLPDVPSPLLSNNSSSLSLPSSSSAISSLPSTLPLMPSANLSSETLPGLMPNKAPSSSLPAANLSASLPSISPLTTSSVELSPIVPPMANKSNVVPSPSIPYQSTIQPTTSAIGVSNSLRVEVPTPSLVTPGQLLQSGPTAIPPSQPVQTTQKDVAQTSHKDVEVVQVSASSSSEPSIPVTAEAQPPILPLPVPSRTNRVYPLPYSYPWPNGAPFHTRHGPQYYRGRGRGTGSSRPVTKFTEDFDFMAMNEKFNKDEVWGHLGKVNKSYKDKEDGKMSDDEDYLDEVDDEVAKIGVKPVYNKDDFFDTLSSNAIGHDSQNGRTRFSEQMKIDTETFGDFPRYRGGRGGRGGPRGGGRYRGSYHGRGHGYGYVGRGRGRSMPNRDS